MSETLIFIPARSGSKRIKNKNIRKINGKPLIYWTIKYAKKYSKSEDILVSSDSSIINQLSTKEKINTHSFDKDENIMIMSNSYNNVQEKGETLIIFVSITDPTSNSIPEFSKSFTTLVSASVTDTALTTYCSVNFFTLPLSSTWFTFTFAI